MSLFRQRSMHQEKLRYHKEERNCRFNEWQLRFKRSLKRSIKSKELKFIIKSFENYNE